MVEVQEGATGPGGLAFLGLTDADEMLLWSLVSRGALTLEEVGSHGGSAEGAREAVARLVRAGVASVDADGKVAPLPPDMSLGSALVQQQQRLDRGRAVLSRLAATYDATRARSGDRSLVEVIAGRHAIRHQLRTLQGGAQSEIVWFCKAGHVVMPSSENVEEFDALRRGVAYRVVYEADLLQEPGMLESVRVGVAAGEQARAASSLPVRLAIVDRSVAICPLVSEAPADQDVTVAVIRSSLLVTALYALFENVWKQAVPLHHDQLAHEAVDAVEALALGQGPALIDDEERQILALMVAAVPDKAIASQLGVSVRTVRRRITSLMERSDCRTRVQLAWRSVHNGWI